MRVKRQADKINDGVRLVCIDAGRTSKAPRVMDRDVVMIETRFCLVYRTLLAQYEIDSTAEECGSLKLGLT